MIIFRPMKLDDLSYVSGIRNHISTRSNLEDDRIISMEETKDWFLQKKPEWYIIVHEDKNVGYVRTSNVTKSSICIGLDIEPIHRRKGYARMAYESFISKLYNDGIKVIWLRVFSNNFAKNLYSSLGFVSINREIKNEKEYETMVHCKEDFINGK